MFLLMKYQSVCFIYNSIDYIQKCFILDAYLLFTVYTKLHLLTF